MTEEPALSWVRAQVNKDLSGAGRGGAGRGEARLGSEASRELKNGEKN